MNYHILLQEAYEQSDIQTERSVIIENPYEQEEEKRFSSNLSYDLSVLNTSIPAEEIVGMVENAIEYGRKNPVDRRGIRMLFYGVSGGGKTNLAHFIADSIGRKILSKHASDILGMYVGESEKHFAEAFNQARKENKILLFDEVDSFFRERSLASHRFEITETNEFLTQMENYDGIVICTTNLRQVMDKAMQRRFHIMVEFKALEAAGIEKLLKVYFPQFNFVDCDFRQLCNYESVTPGDFGNISSLFRFLPPQKITKQYIIQKLCRMQEEKEYGKKTVGFMN